MYLDVACNLVIHEYSQSIIVMTLFNVYIIVAYAITVVIHNRRLTRIIDAIYEMRNKKEERSRGEEKKKEDKICEKRSLVVIRRNGKKQEE